MSIVPRGAIAYSTITIPMPKITYTSTTARATYPSRRISARLVMESAAEWLRGRIVLGMRGARHLRDLPWSTWTRPSRQDRHAADERGPERGLYFAFDVKPNRGLSCRSGHRTLDFSYRAHRPIRSLISRGSHRLIKTMAASSRLVASPPVTTLI